MNTFDDVEEGHYTIVTIPEVGMQIAVSNDYTKPCYVVYNQIDTDQYTKVNTKILKDEYGGTLLKWHNAEQWRHSVENTIQQQRQSRKRVYPTNSEYPIPLDNFPNEEAIAALREDLLAAAQHAGKENEPWNLTMVDFRRIKSGDNLWSFGGNSSGDTYLDRLRREFDMHGTRDAEYAFQTRILRMILYEVFPEFRTKQEEKDEQHL